VQRFLNWKGNLTSIAHKKKPTEAGIVILQFLPMLLATQYCKSA